MILLHTAEIRTPYGVKSIRVFHGDVLDFCEPIDVLTTSAFMYAYNNTPGTMFAALSTVGIQVRTLAKDPLIDLRDLCHVWLSEKLEDDTGIQHIGCIELSGYYKRNSFEIIEAGEQRVINAIRSYFHMLDIATFAGVSAKTVALPLVGSGCQGVSEAMVMYPIINECIAFLKRNPTVEKIVFIEKNGGKAHAIAEALEKSYAILDEEESDRRNTSAAGQKQRSAFISYSSADRNIADNLCSKLESQGIKVWYAPRNVKGPYAASIVEGIQNADDFIVILSRNSLASEHVLNEIDLAFKKLPANIRFHPLRIDDAMFTPSFEYYLSRQHWMDAVNPPLEERLTEFVERIRNSAGQEQK